MRRPKDKFGKAKEIFREKGGILRATEAIKAGVHPRTLYEMVEKEVVEKLSRGVYRIADLPPMGNPDIVSVAVRIPKGVICLVSALAFYEMTTQVPYRIYIAVKKHSWAPRVDYPPVRIMWYGDKAYSSGVETPIVDGVEIRIYSPEKTLADCFKYRNKIGLDTAIEALKLYRDRRRIKIDEVFRFARICRVDKIMRPYLETLI